MLEVILRVPNFTDISKLQEELQEAIDDMGCMDDSQLKNAEVINVIPEDK